MIQVTVPATSANIGVGYDTLGLALNLYARFSFERAERLTITGCPEQFQNENNLIYTAMKRALRTWDEKPMSVAIDIASDVPVSRGLGSSSTCVVAGVLAAAALTERTLDPHEALAITAEIEGHPDNVAPAIYGSAICSFIPSGDSIHCVRYSVSEDLRFVAIIPPYEVSTEAARKVVPHDVALTDAVWQMGRIAAITKGLETGDVELIAAANDDKLHEPYRRPLIADYDKTRAICLANGASTMWISGSGSTMIALAEGDTCAAHIKASVERALPECRALILRADNQGSKVETI